MTQTPQPKPTPQDHVDPNKTLTVNHSDGSTRTITHNGQGTWIKTEHTTPAN